MRRHSLRPSPTATVPAAAATLRRWIPSRHRQSPRFPTASQRTTPPAARPARRTPATPRAARRIRPGIPLASPRLEHLPVRPAQKKIRVRSSGFSKRSFPVWLLSSSIRHSHSLHGASSACFEIKDVVAKASLTHCFALFGAPLRSYGAIICSISAFVKPFFALLEHFFLTFCSKAVKVSSKGGAAYVRWQSYQRAAQFS